MVKNIIITILIVIILCLIGNWHYNKMYDAYGGDLVEKCPVCEVCPDNRITVERIIDDNPTIELPNETVKFKYKGVEYSKVILDEAKTLLEVK